VANCRIVVAAKRSGFTQALSGMKHRPIESQIDTFLAKYSPEVSAQLRSARTHLRAMFPLGYELVYDNYNALVFAFSSTERASGAFLSVAGYPKWVNLFFSHGAGLSDPGRLLQGSGSRVRSIRLQSAEYLLEPAVQALISQAMEPHREALQHAKPLQTSIKAIAAKQRPRRPAARGEDAA
jgi:hypothetical protein